MTLTAVRHCCGLRLYPLRRAVYRSSRYLGSAPIKTGPINHLQLSPSQEEMIKTLRRATNLHEEHSSPSLRTALQVDYAVVRRSLPVLPPLLPLLAIDTCEMLYQLISCGKSREAALLIDLLISTWATTRSSRMILLSLLTDILVRSHNDFDDCVFIVRRLANGELLASELQLLEKCDAFSGPVNMANAVAELALSRGEPLLALTLIMKLANDAQRRIVVPLETSQKALLATLVTDPALNSIKLKLLRQFMIKMTSSTHCNAYDINKLMNSEIVNAAMKLSLADSLEMANDCYKLLSPVQSKIDSTNLRSLIFASLSARQYASTITYWNQLVENSPRHRPELDSLLIHRLLAHSAKYKVLNPIARKLVHLLPPEKYLTPGITESLMKYVGNMKKKALAEKVLESLNKVTEEGKQLRRTVLSSLLKMYLSLDDMKGAKYAIQEIQKRSRLTDLDLAVIAKYTAKTDLRQAMATLSKFTLKHSARGYCEILNEAIDQSNDAIANEVLEKLNLVKHKTASVRSLLLTLTMKRCLAKGEDARELWRTWLLDNKIKDKATKILCLESVLDDAIKRKEHTFWPLYELELIGMSSAEIKRTLRRKYRFKNLSEESQTEWLTAATDPKNYLD